MVRLPIASFGKLFCKWLVYVIQNATTADGVHLPKYTPSAVQYSGKNAFDGFSPYRVFPYACRLPFPVYLFPVIRIDLTRDNPKRRQPIASQKSVFCLACGVSFFSCCLVRPSSRPRGVRYRERSRLALR